MSILERSEQFLPRSGRIESRNTFEDEIQARTNGIRNADVGKLLRDVDKSLVPSLWWLFSSEWEGDELFGDVDRDTIEETKVFFKNIIPHLNFIEITTLSNVIDSAARVASDTPPSDRYERAQKRRELLRIRHILESNRAYKVPKTGSELSLVDHPTGVLFRNTIPRGGLETWQRAEKFVPVCPILRNKKEIPKIYGDRTGNPAAYTRFCGITLNSALHLFRGTPDTSGTYQSMRHQFLEILAKLNHLNIVHGHPHVENFTVEFIRRSALRAHAESLNLPNETDAQLLDSRIVNTFTFDTSNVLFDPVSYARAVSEFIPVVRLIDFDIAREERIADKGSLGPDYPHYAQHLEAGEEAVLNRIRERLSRDGDFQARTRASKR